MSTTYTVESRDMDPAAILKQRREALFATAPDMAPAEFLRAHSELFDDYFRQRFAISQIGPAIAINRNPYAVVALGGYGRAEQCVYSDVDLLLLFENAVPDAAEDLIREYVYPLWDLGLEVGYATRSLRECVKMAKEDLEILTSILDARFLCGISSVYADMTAQVRERVFARAPHKTIRDLVERNRGRHRHYGDATFLLEPNLKEGAGGLRDYHTMRWIGRIKYDLCDLRDLEYHGVLSSREYENLCDALSFIWRVRNRLHYFTGRKCDQLYFDHQERLADEMGLVEEDGQLPVERLMSELHAKMGYVKQQLLLLLFELGFEKPARRSFGVRRQPDIPGIEVSRGGLGFHSSNRIVKSPILLIRIFEAAARLRMPLTREAGRLVREFGYLVDDDFRANPDVRRAFENILLIPAGPVNVLELMLETGFLVRMIPEFGGIVNRIQFDAYHLHPVDRHSLRTIYFIKSFADNPPEGVDPLCIKIYNGLKRKHLLLLAALLHDIGKGRADGKHSATGAQMAPTIMARLGYSSRESEVVSFLIENHLLLVKTASRRDINDEETAIRIAREVGQVNFLKMLYLLTVADSMATGPKAWNNWTATLVRDFFLKILGILEKGELATSGAVRQMEKKKAYVRKASDFPGLDVEAMLEVLSPRYLLYTQARDIVSHIQLYRQLADQPFVWEIVPEEASNTRTVVVCAKDRPGLFSKISGVFTLNGMDVLDAQIYTWRNNIALDIFTVTPPPDQIFEDERWQRAARDLNAALNGNLDLSKALADKQARARKDGGSGRPNRVEVDNETSSFYTIIEVFSYDFPGLLYRITDALARSDLDIWVAKIATKVDQVVDVFYVRDEQGGKVDTPGRVEQIREQVLSALP
ncbi:MAG: [protein-PII] uridylyltransferase [Desulfobacteraceae bacterium]|nr:[protein-PII] uridylyltransferase [Desulfobacteraceae bacterium]